MKTGVNILRVADSEITSDMLPKLIEISNSMGVRYLKLNNYYRANHDIVSRTFDDPKKPNNRIVNNFARYITDIHTGYFTGKPITYKSDNAEYLKKIQDIFDYNDEKNVNAELDKLSAIYGHAFELLWIDEDSQIRFKQVDPREMLMVYNNSLEDIPLAAIRHYKIKDVVTDKTTTFIEVYDSQRIRYYELFDNETEPVFIKEVPHYFGETPVIEYVNNDERIGCFEQDISLIDAYNLTVSDSVNEVNYFNDAYLKLKNMSGSEDEDIRQMKENRVILVDGDGDAEWMVKQVNDTYLENLKTRLANDIHKFSKTPNLVSEEFVSNLSGTAIRYKVWALEQVTATKERKWFKSIQKRIELITNILNLKGSNYDYREITPVFVRNLPMNVMELGQMVSQLRGTVSLETLLGQLPFVDDVAKEIEALKAEKSLSGFNSYGSAFKEEEVLTDEEGLDGQGATE